MSKPKKPVDIDEFDCTMTTYLDSPDLVEYEVEFHEHAKNNNIDKMQQLINKKVDVNCVNKLERTAAHFAAASGHEEALVVLKEADANFELEDKCGMTPLLWAGFYGHLPVIKLLYHLFKVRVDATNKAGMNMLHVAAMNGQVILLDYIAASIQKLNPTQKDKKGRTAFHIAAQAGFADVLKILFRFRRFDLNSKDRRGRTALHWACERGLVDCVNVLLEQRAEFDLEDDDLRTPLYLAVENGHVEIIERLLDFEHFPSTVHRFQTRKSLLHVAASFDHYEVITKFAHRCRLEALDEIRNTALHQAILSGHPLCVQALLRCGANVNATTVQGDSPLHLACQQNAPDIVYLLLQCKEINLYHQNKRGKTALYVAAQGSFLGIVDMIIREQLLRTRQVQALVAPLVTNSADDSAEGQDEVDFKPSGTLKRQVTFADDPGNDDEADNEEEEAQNEEDADEKPITLTMFKREKNEELRGLRERRKTRARAFSEHSVLTFDSNTPSASGGDQLANSKVSFQFGAAQADREKAENGATTPDHPLGEDHHSATDTTDGKFTLIRTRFSRRSQSGRVVTAEKRLRNRRDYIDLTSTASTPFDLYHDGLTRAHNMTNFDLIDSLLHFVAFKVLTEHSWKDLGAIWLFSHEQLRVIAQQEAYSSPSLWWRNHAYRMLRVWFSSLEEHNYFYVTKLLVDDIEQVTAQKRVKKLKKYLLKIELENVKKLSSKAKKTKKMMKKTSRIRRWSSDMQAKIRRPSKKHSDDGDSNRDRRPVADDKPLSTDEIIREEEEEENAEDRAEEAEQLAAEKAETSSLEQEANPPETTDDEAQDTDQETDKPAAAADAAGEITDDEEPVLEIDPTDANAA